MHAVSRVAITGAFGYSGHYIAQRCLARGWSVVTLTNSPQRQSALAGTVTTHPFNFGQHYASELARRRDRRRPY